MILGNAPWSGRPLPTSGCTIESLSDDDTDDVDEMMTPRGPMALENGDESEDIYDDDGIEPLKKQIKSTGKKFNVYVFSLDDSAREEEFDDIKDMVDLKPIPEVILNVYRRIFK